MPNSKRQRARAWVYDEDLSQVTSALEHLMTEASYPVTYLPERPTEDTEFPPGISIWVQSHPDKEAEVVLYSNGVEHKFAKYYWLVETPEGKLYLIVPGDPEPKLIETP